MSMIVADGHGVQGTSHIRKLQKFKWTSVKLEAASRTFMALKQVKVKIKKA